MKNKPAKEMVLAIILCLVTVIIVLTHFIFTMFDVKLILWIVLVVLFAGGFITFYVIKMKQGVFYTFAVMFTINAIFHLLTATYAFKTYDNSHVLESICSLIYLICSSVFFISYLFFLSSTTLEIYRLYKAGIYCLYASSGIMFIQFVVTIFACNEGIYPWGDMFRVLAFSTMFFVHGVIGDGDYTKNQFKFLREHNVEPLVK